MPTSRALCARSNQPSFTPIHTHTLGEHPSETVGRTGRSIFLSVDPDVSQTLSPFAYGTDDPVNRNDPSGLSSAAPSVCMTSICLANERQALTKLCSEGSTNWGAVLLQAIVVFATIPLDEIGAGEALDAITAADILGSDAAETLANVAAETDSGIVQAFRPLDGEAPSGPNISLDQARAAAERNGLDLSNVDLKYESPDAPSYRASGYGYSSFTFSGDPYVNAAGNYEITLQNAGLASEQDAVATIAHEYAHLYLVGPEDHAAAEEFAQQVMEGYVP